MESKQIRVLLIEDNPADARLIQEMLKDNFSKQSIFTHVERLSEGMKYLNNNSFDILLLDLCLPDSEYFETFDKVSSQTTRVPIVVLTGIDDETLAVKAMQMGAQDYLIKGEIDGNSLSHAILYGVERHRLIKELRKLSHLDELTGLYNRRGFLTFTEQYSKLADREGRGMWLLFADFDHLKWINDILGHNKGDKALIDIANVLKTTFRKSNLIARIGGDEFVVLAIGARKDCIKVLINRLQKNLDIFNIKHNNSYELSLSIGAAYYDPEHPCSIEELIARADKSMYTQKHLKQESEQNGMIDEINKVDYL